MQLYPYQKEAVIKKGVSGIYKINLSNGYYYYGQAQCLHIRKITHLSRLKKGTHENDKMQKIFKKFGYFLFEVVLICETRQLCEKEQLFISEHFGNKKCCNLSPSSYSIRGIKRSEESNALIRKARLGVKLSSEHKDNISKGLYNAYKNGRKKPNLFGCKNPFFNKKHSEETKIKISKYRKGNFNASDNFNSKNVLDKETGIFYGSIIEAAFYNGISRSSLSKKLNKKQGHKRFIKC